MPKNKNESFAALRDAVIIRKRITAALKFLSLHAQKRYENLISTDPAADEEKSKLKEAVRAERFNIWLVKQECRTVADTAAELTGSLRSANTIYPSYMSEFTERRNYMNKALAACNVLQDELQFIADAVYADKNKFTALALDIEALFRKIKSVRQADNRFLKNIKSV